MDKPLRSRFMGHDYRISWEPQGSILLEGEDSAGRPVSAVCYGLTDEADQSIRIEDALSPSLERVVLIHEVLHQMFNSSGLELTGEQEEMIVSWVGEAITGHIRANPTFWRYVTRRLPS